MIFIINLHAINYCLTFTATRNFMFSTFKKTKPKAKSKINRDGTHKIWLTKRLTQLQNISCSSVKPNNERTTIRFGLRQNA